MELAFVVVLSVSLLRLATKTFDFATDSLSQQSVMVCCCFVESILLFLIVFVMVVDSFRLECFEVSFHFLQFDFAPLYGFAGLYMTVFGYSFV